MFRKGKQHSIYVEIPDNVLQHLKRADEQAGVLLSLSIKRTVPENQKHKHQLKPLTYDSNIDLIQFLSRHLEMNYTTQGQV